MLVKVLIADDDTLKILTADWPLAARVSHTNGLDYFRARAPDPRG